MNKLFIGGYYTFGLLVLVAIADLIGLTIKGVEFGAGFVIAMAYLIILGFKKK
jgi:hypothetical protein